ncbi:hypothetical protein FNO01nite_30110 [Flavobacterium noncentrifugens]|uniref:DUF3667 domain-containing protein n=1 Tax=Flavobacterium noncentrifugens TaxID=1128970 RepID=A0A1G9BR71_9FLAO|nr:DUF3667 domain-containing protein [Flavobacterium noncentrifugens]GEP52339.1 hypothetical protein FNO01nite_30110 [Flavobacterium noncentrifugens]SDK41903.1 Protein of unknown function [Flavobacterium noncentrifugens]
MDQNYCLNCSEETFKNYCANCGQKTDTHRIKIKHFLLHDVLHGVWHLEKGILFTIKETFVRPGQAALDYIGGKRIRYYNVFYLCLLVIGLNILLTHTFHEIHPKTIREASSKDFDLTGFLSKYLKIAMLSTVPVLAINAKLIFRKLKLNIAEHFIVSGLSLLGMLILSLLFVTMSFINTFKIPQFIGVLYIISFFMILFFPVWSYYDATKKAYRFPGFLWRIILFYVLFLLELMAILMTVIFIMSDSKSIYVNL